MTIKDRAASPLGALREWAAAEKPRLLRIAGCAAELLLGFAMASARIFGLCGPFGIGIVAEAGAGPGSFLCLLGAAAGYLLSGGFDVGIRYVATCLLVFTTAFALRGRPLLRQSWFMPLVAAAATALTAWLNSLELTATAATAVVRMLTEVLLAGGSAWFFRIALSDARRETDAQEKRYAAAWIVLLSCALMSLSRVTLLRYVSVGRVLAALIVLTAARCGGLTAGPAAGTALGLAMDMARGGTPCYAMCYAFCGLVCGVFWGHPKALLSLSFVLANAVSLLWTWGAGLRAEPFFEAFVASVIFLLLPTAAVARAGAIFAPIAPGSGESALRRYTAQRIEALSDAFRDLFETLRGATSPQCNDNDPAKVFDRTADAVCVRCRKRDACWQTGYADTLDLLGNVRQRMSARGQLRKNDLPPRFLERCIEPDAFLSALNAELRASAFRRQFRARLGENRAAACAQYADMAVVLETAAKELASAQGTDPLAERRLLRWLRSRDVDARASVFRDGRGRLRAVLESGALAALTKDPAYLDKLSGVLGVRLCRPAADGMGGDTLHLLQAEPLAVSVGIAAMKKEGEPVSGDRGTYFKTDGGVLCVLLSDGMGAGAGAAKDSVAAVRVLERFLRAGVEPVTAMKLLNGVMLLRSGENWGCATVDLVCIDLFTGETCFYKYGAAPSYVRSGSLVRRVKGRSLAAGLLAGEGAAPDVVRMRLRPGNVALIASDGVLAEEKDGWLRELLLGAGDDMKALAQETLRGAVRQYGCEDDMTVLAVRMDRRP